VAAGNGDRSENADYQYGKAATTADRWRIRFLTKRIEAAEVVPGSSESGAAGDEDILRSDRALMPMPRDGAVVSIVGTDESISTKPHSSWCQPWARVDEVGSGRQRSLQAPGGTEY